MQGHPGDRAGWSRAGMHEPRAGALTPPRVHSERKVLQEVRWERTPGFGEPTPSFAPAGCIAGVTAKACASRMASQRPLGAQAFRFHCSERGRSDRVVRPPFGSPPALGLDPGSAGVPPA